MNRLQAVHTSVFGVCCRVLQCVAVCCSVVQCGAVCCSVLQCIGVYLVCHSIAISNLNHVCIFSMKLGKRDLENEIND